MAILKILLLVVILVVVVASVVIPDQQNLDNGVTRLNEDVRLAGTADGKTFFAVFTNSSTGLNWHEARAACIGMNMTLAEITSKAQADAIRSFANSNQIWDFGYWVAGRDAWELRQISWDLANEAVSEDIGDVYIGVLLPLSCVYFYPYNGSSKARIYLYGCTSKLRYRLCEVPTSSKSI